MFGWRKTCFLPLQPEMNFCEKMNNKSSLFGHFVCFTVYAIFGFNIVVCKDLTADSPLSPVALFCLRSLVAGSLFWLTSLFLPKEKVEKKDFIKIFAASFLGFFLTQISFLMAIPNITPMDCSIITSMSPIFTMFTAAIVLKEPITLKKAGGVLLSFSGIIYLILNGVGSVSGVTVTKPVGVLLMLVNSLSFSLYLGIFKPLISKYSAITFVKWIFLFSSLLSLPLVGKEIVSVNYFELPTTFLLELSYLIFAATYITYFMLPLGQKRIRPTLVSMYNYLQPIIATGVSIYIGMDTLSWQKIAAAIMVFGGVVVVSYSKSAKDVKQE